MIIIETFDKFMADIQKQIEEKDKANKEKADLTLKTIAETYRQKVAERVANETALAEECRKIGNDAGAKHHSSLAEIYRSLFNIYASQ